MKETLLISTTLLLFAAGIALLIFGFAILMSVLIRKDETHMWEGIRWKITL